MLNVKEMLEKVKNDPSIILVPDYSHVDDIKVLGTVIVKFDDIYTDDILRNRIRQKGYNPKDAEALKQEFAAGVQPHAYPPAIMKREGKSEQTYELVYGYTRCDALTSLHMKEWYFTLLEGPESARKAVQAVENFGHYKTVNTENDLRGWLIDAVSTGVISNSEDAIQAYLVKTLPHQNKTSVGRIVQSVVTETKAPVKFELYNENKCKQWFKNHCSDEYIIGGHLDTKRNMFGLLVKEGYEYRAWMRAIKNMANTGKKTYAIVHMGAPGKKQATHEKRNSFMRNHNKIQSALKSGGYKESPLVIMGALPQEYGIDNWKELIKI